MTRDALPAPHPASLCFCSLVIAVTLLTGGLASPVRAEDQARGRYIVVLNSAIDAETIAAEHERRYDARVTHVYGHAISGYSAELPEDAVAHIARDNRVLTVQEDVAVTTFAQTQPTGIARASVPANTTVDIDGTDDVRVDVDVAVIDTGIDPDHPDLDVVASIDCTGGATIGSCHSGGLDDNGHGTHVAGTIGAIDNDFGVVGVAPGARLHSVKVLTASGYGLMSDVIAGIDWVTARADTIEVANMSLGCRCTIPALDQALSASAARGVVYAVSAGNDKLDTAEFSPAGHPEALTVSALADFDGRSGAHGRPTCRLDEDDTLGNFSNWGPEVDIAAPGTCILSTSYLGGYRTLSGTSMAAPHVAGAAAILTSGANEPHDGTDVAAVRDAILGSGTFDWTDESGDGITEPLLNVGNADLFVANSATRTLGEAPPTSGNQPPMASFTETCSGSTCDFDATGSSDGDGTIAGYSWDFGDGTTGSGAQVTKTFAATGPYTVTLTVTDDDGTAATTSRDVTIGSTNNDEPEFDLGGSGARAGTHATVRLSWRGTDRAGTIDVYRNGVAIATTADDGSWEEVITNASGRYTYKVCESGTTRCSNEFSPF